MNRAIFTDKDGTLIKNVPYNVNPSLIELQPFAGEALKKLQDKGYEIIVVSNQSGVARGRFREEKLQGVEQELERQLSNYGVKLKNFYYCPHHPKGAVEEYRFSCNCRKPKPGLLLKAATANTINLSKSWLIGDILNDVEAGNRAGCKTILFDNGGETEWQMNKKRTPDHVIKSWEKIVSMVLGNETDTFARSNAINNEIVKEGL